MPQQNDYNARDPGEPAAKTAAAPTANPARVRVKLAVTRRVRARLQTRTTGSNP